MSQPQVERSFPAYYLEHRERYTTGRVTKVEGRPIWVLDNLGGWSVHSILIVSSHRPHPGPAPDDGGHPPGRPRQHPPGDERVGATLERAYVDAQSWIQNQRAEGVELGTACHRAH